MNPLSLAACCAFALAATATLAQAQTTVPRADKNMTGNVTLAEYQKSRAAFILRADANKDGKVARAEWDTFAKAVRRDLELGGVAGAERIGQGEWWGMLDANKDNVVTQAEISATTKAQFARYDTDKNSFISRAEATAVQKRAQATLK